MEKRIPKTVSFTMLFLQTDVGGGVGGYLYIMSQVDQVPIDIQEEVDTRKRLLMKRAMTKAQCEVPNTRCTLFQRSR